MAVEGWARIHLGEFVTFQRGHDLPNEERRPGSVPILGSFGITGWHDKAKARGPGVTIGRSGASIGTASYSPVDYWPLNTALYVIDFHGNDERFAFYFLKCLDFRGYNSGSAQPSLNRNLIHPITIDVPPLAAQRSIAHILDSLDEKIELNRRMNETLEAMARALFKAWFVDFDPVRSKAEGRETGLPRHLADLFPNSFEDSELGPVPSGWNPREWGELVSLEYGRGLTGYEREDGAYAVYGTNGRIGSHSEALCPHAGIIVGRKGAYRGVHYCDAPFFVIDTAFYLAPKVPLEMRWAYYELLRMDINSMDSGSAIPSTSRKEFYGISVVAPPVLLQQRYVELLKPMWLRQARNEFESRTLATLRDSLLPKLISGELRVKDAERFLEERGL